MSQSAFPLYCRCSNNSFRQDWKYFLWCARCGLQCSRFPDPLYFASRKLIADMRIYEINALLEAVCHTFFAKHKSKEEDLYLRTLSTARVQEEEYFGYVVSKGISATPTLWAISPLRYVRMREGFDAENMNILRHLALNFLKSEKSYKCSLK